MKSGQQQSGQYSLMRIAPELSPAMYKAFKEALIKAVKNPENSQKVMVNVK